MKTIGDNVIIRKDLIAGMEYGNDDVVEGMLAYLGMDAIIMDIWCGEYILNVDDGDYCWTPEMIEN